MTEHVCVLCRVYRPEAEARPAQNVCPGDLARLRRDLLAVPTLFHRVATGDPAEADTRWYEVIDEHGDATGRLRRRDPIAALLPAGTVRARTNEPTLTGTREAHLPIDVDAVDLTAPARAAQVGGEHGDQVGHLSVRTVLDAWVRHVRDRLNPGGPLPDTGVDHLVDYLDKRLDDIVEHCTDQLPQLASDLRLLTSALRQTLHEIDPPPRPLIGVRCEHCRTISTLVPWTSGEYVECQNCGQLYNHADRIAVAREQVADLTRTRTVVLDGRLDGLGDDG